MPSLLEIFLNRHIARFMHGKDKKALQQVMNQMNQIIAFHLALVLSSNLTLTE